MAMMAAAREHGARTADCKGVRFSWGLAYGANSSRCSRLKRALPSMDSKEPFRDIDASQIVSLHQRRTETWHREAPVAGNTGLLGLVEDNHLRNFQLWHQEDEARRDDKGCDHVYRAKRTIDRLNRERNDLVELIDDALLAALPPFPPDCPMNSETPGMIVDRLSILALRVYHMQERISDREPSGGRGESAVWAENLLRTQDQLAALSDDLDLLLAGMRTGKRGFRTFRQFKMYLNPEPGTS